MVFPARESTATINIEPIIDGTVEGIEEIVIEVASVTCDGLTNTISLFIDDEPLQVSVEENSPVCPGDLTMLFAETTGDVPPYTYVWSDGAVVNEYELVFTTSENVTVTVTDACGAQVEGGIIIDVPIAAPLVVDLGEDQMLQCADDITLTPAVSGGLGAYTYEWIVNGNEVADEGSYTFSVSADTEVILAISDGCGSTAQDEILLSVVQYPAVVWSGDDRAICLGETANRAVESQGGYGYLSITWLHNGDSSWETSAAPGASSNFEFVITDECGTNTTGSIYVEVSLIEAGFTYTQLGTNTIAFESLSVNALTHEWDFGDRNTSEEENPTHEYESRFDFTAVTLTVENDAGCRASVSKVIPP